MGFKDECGVFGAFGHKNASHLCYLGLYSLQHRGQESAGIVSFDGTDFYAVKEMGLVSKVFDGEKTEYLKGESAIGHVRYSTTGASNINNIQPLYSQTSKGRISIAHNGNLTNAFSLIEELEKIGALFQTTIDSEVILHLLSRSSHSDFSDALGETLGKIEGAFSLVMLGENFLVAARDRHGFRPLVLGKKDNSYFVSSETCALDLIGAEYIREIEPGEIIIISKEGIISFTIPSESVIQPAHCIFEHVYFSRPDSQVFGDSVHLVRKEMGRQLSIEHPAEADIVMSIPDSGNSAALGFAEQSGIPFEIGMTRNHYVGRTFIQPEQSIRDFSVKVKLNPIKHVLKGKRVVVVDDSLVRGTTAKRRVSAILEAGATEVHLRISSPPIQFPCHMGIDTPDRDQLIAANKTTAEIMRFVGANSLGFLSIDGMKRSTTAHKKSNYCSACFSGKYPLDIKNKGKYIKGHGKINLYAEKR
ncbi:amidophosphoribosyltransferase [bacterium]|jgi:amidophosphoribosyltransferase|nr:amidophosphoribosyltransferase [bacterium]